MQKDNVREGKIVNFPLLNLSDLYIIFTGADSRSLRLMLYLSKG